MSAPGKLLLPISLCLLQAHTLEIEKSLAICKEFEFVVWKVTTIKRNTFPIQKNKNTQKGKDFSDFHIASARK